MVLVGHAPSLFLRGCSGKPCFIGKVFQKDCVTGLTLSGTGKTYTAFQIVYRLLTSGVKRKILYLADRNNLVDQSIQQDFSPLEKVIHKVNFAKDKKDTITALYICQHCGTKYTSEEAKKLFGKVEIDKTDDIKKLIVLARRASKTNSFQDAEKYYGMILQNDPNNWEDGSVRKHGL